MKYFSISGFVGAVALSAVCVSAVQAADYAIDSEGMHAYVEFKVPHLGFSVLSGRFNELEGTFSWDKDKPQDAAVTVTIQTASLDSNHEKRDSHLKSPQFLNVGKHPTATFTSTAYAGDASGGKLTGDLTLNGVTKSITLDVDYVGEGKDPWGGYRAGFTGTTTLTSSDFGYKGRMFPTEIDMALGIEGIRQ